MRSRKLSRLLKPWRLGAVRHAGARRLIILGVFVSAASQLRGEESFVSAPDAKGSRGRPGPGSRWEGPLQAGAAGGTAVADYQQDPLLLGKKGRAGGGGGGEPTPEEVAQVLLYRAALCLCAFGWWACYALDFFMTSGIEIIDGSMQATALQVADVSAGVAALAMPTGSLLALGVAMKLLGSVTLVTEFLGSSCLRTSAAGVLGPLCLMLICAREVYWFGLAFRAGALVGSLVFGYVALLRSSGGRWDPLALPAGEADTAIATPAAAAEDDAGAGAIAIGDLPLYVAPSPVGPPVLVSFLAAALMIVLSIGKLFDPIGEDLDEEGEQWSKPSSRPLDDAPRPGDGRPPEDGDPSR